MDDKLQKDLEQETRDLISAIAAGIKESHPHESVLFGWIADVIDASESKGKVSSEEMGKRLDDLLKAMPLEERARSAARIKLFIEILNTVFPALRSGILLDMMSQLRK